MIPAIFRSPKSAQKRRETLFEIVNVRRAHPVLALRFDHFFRQLRDGHVAPADPLQIIQVERGCVVDGLAVFGEFLAGLDDCGEFARGRPTASRPWRSKVVICRSRSASASALVLKNFRPRLKGRRSRYQGCVLLWRYSRTLRVGRFMAPNNAPKRLRMSIQSQLRSLMREKIVDFHR